MIARNKWKAARNIIITMIPWDHARDVLSLCECIITHQTVNPIMLSIFQWLAIRFASEAARWASWRMSSRAWNLTYSYYQYVALFCQGLDAYCLVCKPYRYNVWRVADWCIHIIICGAMKVITVVRSSRGRASMFARYLLQKTLFASKQQFLTPIFVWFILYILLQYICD